MRGRVLGTDGSWLVHLLKVRALRRVVRGRGCDRRRCGGPRQVDVKDTVGCGDSFAAAVVLGYIRGHAVPPTLALANAVRPARAPGAPAKPGLGSMLAYLFRVRAERRPAGPAGRRGVSHGTAALQRCTVRTRRAPLAALRLPCGAAAEPARADGRRLGAGEGRERALVGRDACAPSSAWLSLPRRPLLPLPPNCAAPAAQVGAMTILP